MNAQNPRQFPRPSDIITLKPGDYTVVPEAGPIPDDVFTVFQATKRRMEASIGQRIDLETDEGRGLYNSAVFKAILDTIQFDIDAPRTPPSVRKPARDCIETVRGNFPMQPKRALSYAFERTGFTLVESLYECGYAESSEGAKKNVEQLENLARALGLPETLDDWKRNALRFMGSLRRFVDHLGRPDEEAHGAASRFLELLSLGEWRPDTPIGPHRETALFLILRSMADPRNQAAAVSAFRILREDILSVPGPDGSLFVSNPYLRDSFGRTVRDAMLARTEAIVGVSKIPKARVADSFRLANFSLMEAENDFRLAADLSNRLETPGERLARGRVDRSYGPYGARLGDVG